MSLVQRIIMCISIMAFIKPSGVTEMFPLLDIVLYKFVALLCSAYIIPFTLVKIYHRNISVFFVWLLVFVIYGLIVTQLRRGDVETYLSSWFYPIVMLCLFENNKSNEIFLLRVVFCILEIIVIINLFYMILFPDGTYATDMYDKNWLLGYKSSFQYFFFPILFLAHFFFLYYKEFTNFLVVLIVIHFETIIAWNAMFLVVLIIYDIIFFFNLLKIEIIFNIRNYILSILIINISFVFFFIQLLNQGPVSYLFGDILGKDESLMDRLTMWLMAVKYFVDSPFLGYGYLRPEDIAKFSGVEQPHVHNQWLNILFFWGLIGTIIFIYLMRCVIKQLHQYYHLFIAKICALFIWLLFLSVTVEVFISGQAMCIWPIFLVAYNVNSIDNQLSPLHDISNSTKTYAN